MISTDPFPAPDVRFQPLLEAPHQQRLDFLDGQPEGLAWWQRGELRLTRQTVIDVVQRADWAVVEGKHQDEQHAARLSRLYTLPGRPAISPHSTRARNRVVS